MSSVIHEDPCQGTMCFCSHRKSSSRSVADERRHIAWYVMDCAARSRLNQQHAVADLLSAMSAAIAKGDYPRTTSAPPKDGGTG